MLDQVSLAYGGFDSICVTAGIFVPFARSGAALAGLFRTPPRVQTSEIALGSD